jgi:hypothetical protein
VAITQQHAFIRLISHGTDRGISRRFHARRGGAYALYPEQCIHDIDAVPPAK